MSKRVIYKEWVFTNIRNQRAVLLAICVILLGWNSFLTYQVNRLNHCIEHLLIPSCGEPAKLISDAPKSEANKTSKDLSSFTLVDVPVLK